MEIKIQIKGHIYSVCFGKKTKWFQSTKWLWVEEQWYQNNEIVYAKLLKTW